MHSFNLVTSAKSLRRRKYDRNYSRQRKYSLCGISLPSSSVSPYDTRAKSDFWLYVVYVLSTFILYASCTTTLFFVVSKSEQEGIEAFTKRNLEVFIATIVVIGSFILWRFVQSLLWQSYGQWVWGITWLVLLYLQLPLYIMVLACSLYTKLEGNVMDITKTHIQVI